MAPPQPPGKVFDSVRQDIHTLDSKISLIAQKLKTIEQNEEIIGRTIVAHNEKIRELDEKGSSGLPNQDVVQSASSASDLSQLKKDVEDLRKEVSEMRYVINSINPLEYATIDQVKDLFKEKKD